jgi:hypothetical protein
MASRHNVMLTKWLGATETLLRESSNASKWRYLSLQKIAKREKEKGERKGNDK